MISIQSEVFQQLSCCAFTMSFVRDIANYVKFEAQNWWSSITWTEDSIPNLR